VAEPQRAFGDPSQLFDIWRTLDHYGVGLWIPEVGGPADIRNEGHNIVLSTFGTMSESERRRIGVTVSNATREMARSDVRYWLGARAPFGYRLTLTDEPHPKPAKAREGARLRRLEVEPTEAAIVREIFERTPPGTASARSAPGSTPRGCRRRCKPGPTSTTGPGSAAGRTRRLRASSATAATPGTWRGPGPAAASACATSGTRASVTAKSYLVQPKGEWVWSPEPTHEPIIPSWL
jgi:hypothetical protein